MAGRNSHGRQYANGRLLRRLDGKVAFDQFITALRNIGHGELADRIEGLLLLVMIPLCQCLFQYSYHFTV